MILKIKVRYKYHPADYIGLPDHSREYDACEIIYAPPPITDGEIRRAMQRTNKYLVYGSIDYEVEEIKECANGQDDGQTELP